MAWVPPTWSSCPRPSPISSPMESLGTILLRLPGSLGSCQPHSPARSVCAGRKRSQLLPLRLPPGGPRWEGGFHLRSWEEAWASLPFGRANGGSWEGYVGLFRWRLFFVQCPTAWAHGGSRQLHAGHLCSPFSRAPGDCAPGKVRLLS